MMNWIGSHLKHFVIRVVDSVSINCRLFVPKDDSEEALLLLLISESIVGSWTCFVVVVVVVLALICCRVDVIILTLLLHSFAVIVVIILVVIWVMSIHRERHSNYFESGRFLTRSIIPPQQILLIQNVVFVNFPLFVKRRARRPWRSRIRNRVSVLKLSAPVINVCCCSFCFGRQLEKWCWTGPLNFPKRGLWPCTTPRPFTTFSPSALPGRLTSICWLM